MPGRPFLQIPGPTNVPDRVLRAMDRPLLDHRSPEFGTLTKSLLPPLRTVFDTAAGEIFIYPSSGTGAWEAALVNTLRPGDRVLVFQYGQFSAGAAQIARNLGYTVDEVVLRWGDAPTPALVEERLRADDPANPYAALLLVHNETATGVLCDLPGIRAALDRVEHGALLVVDAVSSLASMPFAFDDWGIDLALTGSQKGLMLPPGLGIVCAGPRAMARAEAGGSPRHYFDWRPLQRDNANGFFPYTPAIALLFGLREALTMLIDEEGLPNVFARHARLAGGVRAAVDAWGLELLCADPERASNTVTAVVMPASVDSDAVIRRARERFGLSLGGGLGQLKGRVLRIGHLGALNELEVLATLGGAELALVESGAALTLGSGVTAAQQQFQQPTTV